MLKRNLYARRNFYTPRVYISHIVGISKKQNEIFKSYSMKFFAMLQSACGYNLEVSQGTRTISKSSVARCRSAGTNIQDNKGHDKRLSNLKIAAMFAFHCHGTFRCHHGAYPVRGTFRASL